MEKKHKMPGGMMMKDSEMKSMMKNSGMEKGMREEQKGMSKGMKSVAHKAYSPDSITAESKVYGK